MMIIAAIAAAIFGVERVTRWYNRRLERQTRNDELWERITREK